MNDPSQLYVVYVASVVIPLLFQSWRLAILALGFQGILLGAIVVSHHHPMSAQLIFEYGYLFGVRGLFLPIYLFRHRGVHAIGDQFLLIRTNLFQWMAAGSLVALAYIFSTYLCPDDPLDAGQVGAAGVSLLIGMLILSHQSDRLGQVVGLFVIEGGITLIELLSPHAIPFPVHVGVVAVFILLVLTCGKYLHPEVADSSDADFSESEPALSALDS